MFRRPFLLTLCILFAIILMAACSKPTEIVTLPPLTDTRLPATNTQPSPTSTPVPPTRTSTPIPPTRIATATSTPTKITTPVVGNIVINCPGAPDIILKLGDWAMVSTDSALPNKVRSQPGSNGELLGLIQPGENVLVQEGPQCADGYSWWFVRSLDGLEGWTAEGDAAGYWLVDPISAWYELPEPLTSRGLASYDLRELSIQADRALISGITGNFNPLATPMPRPQTPDTPEPDDPRYSEFGTTSYAAHSFYDTSGILDGYFIVYDLEDPLSRYYLNNMSYDDCTQALRDNLVSEAFVPAYLEPFCGINGGIPLLFIAGIEPIQFVGGEGVRYLLASGNNLTANTLYYNFQGLSDDGRYFIRGHFSPIAHPYIVDPLSLQHDFGPLLAWTEGQYEEAQESYDLFNSRIEELLNAGVVTLYPSLEFLDDMLASIVIK
jgi:hypothetical protein